MPDFAGSNEMEGVGACLVPTLGVALTPPPLEIVAVVDVVTGALLAVFLAACCATLPGIIPTLPGTGVICVLGGKFGAFN